MFSSQCISMRWCLSFIFLVVTFVPAAAQSLGGAGTIEGVVSDPSGAIVTGAQVEIRNSISGYKQNAVTDAAGTFRFSNVPPNPYRLRLEAPGFAVNEQDVTVRTAVPVVFKITKRPPPDSFHMDAAMRRSHYRLQAWPQRTSRSSMRLGIFPETRAKRSLPQSAL